MLTFCPSCQKQLKVPDHAMGKQVRCPACQTVFTAEDSSPANQVQAVPPPLMPPPYTSPGSSPPPLPSAPPPSPWNAYDSPGLRRDLDDAGEDFDEFGQSVREAKALSRARSAGFWLTLGGIANLVTIVFNITSTLLTGQMPHNEDERFGFICGLGGCFALAIPMVIFMFVAASNLKSFRSRGLVITGSVMGFIFGAIFILGALINFVGLLMLMGNNAVFFPQNLVAVIFTTLLLTAGTSVCNFIGAIKAVVASNDVYLHRRFQQAYYR